MNNKKSNNRNPQPPAQYLKTKNRGLRHNYNVTIEEYEHILNEIQQGLCPVCLTPAPSLFEMAVSRRFWPVDHDHGCCPTSTSCGKCIRGVLCSMCNALLTVHWEDPEWRDRALTYLGVK